VVILRQRKTQKLLIPFSFPESKPSQSTDLSDTGQWEIPRPVVIKYLFSRKSVTKGITMKSSLLDN
jgi:hypothetical protein